ncbi:MAG: hypothetical protein ACRDPD_07920 [Streptosporangiaceae bacterium]
MTGKITPLHERDTSTVQAAADAYLSLPQLGGGGRSAVRCACKQTSRYVLGASASSAVVTGVEQCPPPE